jgi:adenylate cyclase
VCPLSQRGLPDPAYVKQMCRMRQGLRIAGLRESAQEDADFGQVSDGILRCGWIGLTPRTIPGAKTILTRDLTDFLVRRKPLLIDAAWSSGGRSLPGAIGLQGLGRGANFSDRIQTRLRRKIHELTNGELSAPIVAYCGNSERLSGYNLVLRLVALGYTQVHWYRGGWEAWQVAGLPETELELQNW